MRILILLFVTLPLVACQTENSSTQDAGTYSSIGGSPGFSEARAIFATSCTGCHSYHTMTEEQLKADPATLLVGGSPTGSKLYTRLAGAPGGNMPQGGALSSADVRAIYDWISNVP